MAINNSINKTSYGADKNILIAPELAFTTGCQVTNTGVVADSNGRKIIKAGTPVGGTTSALLNRQAVLVVTNNANAGTPAESDGKNSQGVILHDVDVTNGQEEAKLVVFGFVDINKVPTINSAALTALTKITFMKGE